MIRLGKLSSLREEHCWGRLDLDNPRLVFGARLFIVSALLLALLAVPAAALGQDVQDEILAQTGKLRGLAPKAAVPFEQVNSDQLRQDLLKSYNDETAIRDLEISRKLLVVLGLLNPDADLHSMLIDLYAENVSGYYNNSDKKMYVVSGRTTFGAEEKVTLAHEFTHALQDQYFDLAKLKKSTEENGDYSLAVQALIEGDATLTMVLYARTFLSLDELFRLQSESSPSSIDRAPLVIRDEVTFPYNEGALFALRLWQDGGFESLNQAFRDPPRSTEQILHPEKYITRDHPVEVSLPDLAAALGPGWTQLRSDVLGELDVRIVLQQFMDQAMAAKGAEGWGGDRFSLLENAAGQNALAISTVWDSDEEGGEFFNHYLDSVARRYGTRARRVEDVSSKIVWTTPNGSMLMQKWGPRVAIVMAPNSGVMNTILAAIAPGGAAQTQGPAPVQVPR